MSELRRLYGMRRLVLAATLLLSACSQSGPAVAAQRQSPSIAAASASALSSSEPSTIPSCRLPVTRFQDGRLDNGFITLPSGSYVTDPAGMFQTAPDGRLESSTAPRLYGRGQSVSSSGQAATYTRRYGRWLPMPISAISPDSSHYAYDYVIGSASLPRAIHVVDVQSGGDRIVNQQDFYSVLDYESEGIYLVNVGPVGEAARGLWLLKLGQDDRGACRHSRRTNWLLPHRGRRGLVRRRRLAQRTVGRGHRSNGRGRAF